MNKDIRVLTTFPRHPKTIKLKRLLGTWEPIITLWLWCAENRPTGDLSGLEPDDLAIAAGWNDDPKSLIDALLNVRFIETTNNGAYCLHGWEEHNAYAANAEKRSESARSAAASKWKRRLSETNQEKRSKRLSDARERGSHVQSEWDRLVHQTGGVCLRCGKIGVVKDHIIPIYQGGSDAISNLQPLCRACNSQKGPDTTDYRQAFCKDKNIDISWVFNDNACGVSANACDSHKETPAPSPSPSPSPNKYSDTSYQSPANQPDPLSCPHQKIVDLYHEILPELPRIKDWHKTRQQHLRQRWAENKKRQDLDWWRRLFDYIKTKCPLLLGENDRHWTADLEWICKKSNFVKIIEGKYERSR